MYLCFHGHQYVRSHITKISRSFMNLSFMYYNKFFKELTFVLKLPKQENLLSSKKFLLYRIGGNFRGMNFHKFYE